MTPLKRLKLISSTEVRVD